MIDALRTPDEAFDELPDFAYHPHAVDDLAGFEGLRLSYIDEGPRDAARVFLCLHGEPTWSFLYRKMIPRFVATGSRVIAPDFFGFGRSDKPLDERIYTFSFHRRTLLALIDHLDLREIVLVCQDWGGLIGLTLPLDRPERFGGLFAMNTALATGDVSVGPGFLKWRAYVEAHPDLDVAAIMQRSVPHLTPEEAAAYAAPFPDFRYKAGVRAFPPLVPLAPGDEGAALARNARTWWRTAWDGPAFIGVGLRDPVLGMAPMQYLHSVVRNSPEPVPFAEGGHFLQEWGDDVAAAGLPALGLA